MLDSKPLKALTIALLNQARNFEWTVQGFGFIRTYLDPAKRWRLNVWHSALAVPGVSTIHDHPWDFTSYVIAGTLYNTRFASVPGHIADHLDRPFMRLRLQCGVGGGPRGGSEPVTLSTTRQETTKPGGRYCQRAEEIHETSYDDGTVTLNDRRPRPDGEHANVFYPAGHTWVSAEPRVATAAEVELAVAAALKQLAVA